MESADNIQNIVQGPGLHHTHNVATQSLYASHE